MQNLKYKRTIRNFTDGILDNFLSDACDVPFDVFMGYIELLEINGFKKTWNDNVLSLIGYNQGRKFRNEIVLTFGN